MLNQFLIQKTMKFLSVLNQTAYVPCKFNGFWDYSLIKKRSEKQNPVAETIQVSPNQKCFIENLLIIGKMLIVFSNFLLHIQTPMSISIIKKLTIIPLLLIKFHEDKQVTEENLYTKKEKKTSQIQYVHIRRLIPRIWFNFQDTMIL